MSAVLAHHPETGADLMVDDGQLVHMRVSGWMLRSEWEVHEAAVAAAKVAQEKASSKPATATAAAKTGQEK